MDGMLFFTIFILVWLGPIIAGVIVAKKKNRSSHWFWLGICPGFGLWIFIIMLFLKPLEICVNCQQKIPSGSKVCPYCTKETTLSSKTKEEIATLKKKQNKRILITVIIVVAIFTVFGSVILTSVYSSFKNCIPYKYSIELIEHNEEIKSYLGNDFKQKGMISGSISTRGDSSGKATFSYKIKGKNGISIVYIDAYKENGIWNYNKLNFYKKEKFPDFINLLEGK